MQVGTMRQYAHLFRTVARVLCATAAAFMVASLIAVTVLPSTLSVSGPPRPRSHDQHSICSTKDRLGPAQRLGLRGERGVTHLAWRVGLRVLGCLVSPVASSTCLFV